MITCQFTEYATFHFVAFHNVQMEMVNLARDTRIPYKAMEECQGKGVHKFTEMFGLFC
jgi:hypothetical protein